MDSFFMWNGTNYLMDQMDQVDQMDKTDYPAFFRPCGPLGPCGPLKTLFTHFTTGAILSFCFYILLPVFVTNRQWTIKKTCG